MGAGYNAMMGVTQLLKRSVLGVPGTPFALIMGYSTNLEGFKRAMLLNFYNNRHVKVMVSLCQMGWDTVEAGGLLAPPINEPLPPVLIQAGFGDAEVTTVAAEILARSYGAKLLPGNPRPVFGLDVVQPANELSVDDEPGPRSAITEIMYTKEYNQGRLDGKINFNNVHYCVRQDSALQKQIVQFVSKGIIIDPCENDNCIRQQAWC